ncbi:DUF1330 domain-containing protein [Paracoccus sp. pheM1]|uniref:DUF1330 domain-containing protein n=1 Tax=Paracoccus sp. pheM1 TaxID=2831675 RepID=UPI001BDB74CE|nr:DUF1330 domain-containing protein [Paracoccus sp. pheM1]MBT0781232.1 DUF1330 domain-containing protein [Paracoccus sp. pheM1]
MSAYRIAHVTVLDPEAYAGYQALAPAAFAKFGAEFLVRGGASETLEGPALQHHVVIRFPDLTRARACFHSPEYREARARRDGACEAHVVIVEGVSDPSS